MCPLVEAIGEQPDADVEQYCHNVCPDYPAHRTRLAYPVEEVLHAFIRDELTDDEQNNQRNKGVEQEIDKERPGDVVAILPGIGEAEEESLFNGIKEPVMFDIRASLLERHQ